MKKKVLQELIENAKQNEKNIYQRYNGIITKYIDNGDYYINCETGFATKKNEHLMLGKVSKDITDLIEAGAIINGKEVLDIYKPRDVWEPIEIRVDSRYENFILTDEIKTILTHEQYKANCYKVGGE